MESSAGGMSDSVMVKAMSAQAEYVEVILSSLQA